jgi:hypothetical protein
MYDDYYLSTNILHYVTVNLHEKTNMCKAARRPILITYETHEFVHCTQIDDQIARFNTYIEIKAASNRHEPSKLI